MLTSLLWGTSRDSPVAAVHAELCRMRMPVLVLEQREVLGTEVRYSADGESPCALLLRGRTIDLDKVSALYVRPYDARRVPSVARGGVRRAARGSTC